MMARWRCPGDGGGGDGRKEAVRGKEERRWRRRCEHGGSGSGSGGSRTFRIDVQSYKNIIQFFFS